jgi:hypothetical protein
MKARARWAEARTLSIEDYHLDREFESSSTLKLFRKSPAEYHERRVLGRIADVQTDPQRLGSLDHVTVIEPHNFDKVVRIIPEEVLGKNGAKSTNAWYAWEKENAGFIHARQCEVDQSRELANEGASQSQPSASTSTKQPSSSRASFGTTAPTCSSAGSTLGSKSTPS